MTDDNPKSKSTKLLHRLLTISLIVLVVAVVAFTIYIFVNKPAAQSNVDATTEVASLENDKDNILQSAHATDSYESFLQTYDDKISQAQTPEAQSYLYRLRASDILSKYYDSDQQDQYKQQAIADILKAYELTPTAAIAEDVATCYEWVDESDLAAQYYTLAEQETHNEN